MAKKIYTAPYTSRYTPEVIATTNCSIGVIKEVAFKVEGDWVTVFGEVQIVPTTNGLETDFTISVPIDSAATSTNDGRGVLTMITTGLVTTGGIWLSVANTMKARFVAQHQSTGYQYGFNFSYRIT